MATSDAAYGAITAVGEVPKASRNLNVDAAYLHVIGDLVQSIGVAMAGLLIWWKPSWKIADPCCTILFGFIVMYTTVSMAWSNVSVLLEGVPLNVDLEHIRSQLRDIRGVTDVHDLHCWALSSGSPLLTVHVAAADPAQALSDAQAVCKRAGITHATVQVIPSGTACPSATCCT